MTASTAATLPAPTAVPVLSLADPLPGFPGLRDFALVAADASGLVFWLQSVAPDGPRFLTVPAAPYFPEYAPALPRAACAELGYSDCTPRVTRPAYLEDGAAWAELRDPARIGLDGPILCAVPTSHGIGDLARALVRPGLPPRVHTYFHDTDLVDRRRRALIVGVLTMLGRRRPATDLDVVAAS